MKSIQAEKVPAISFEDAAQAALNNAARHKEIGDKHLAAGLSLLAEKEFAKAERQMKRAERLMAALSRG